MAGRVDLPDHARARTTCHRFAQWRDPDCPVHPAAPAGQGAKFQGRTDRGPGLGGIDDADHEHVIPKAGIAKAYGSYSNQEVAVAMYAGVVQAYQLEKLPYRSIILDEPNLTYSLGLYMALRMREVMYIAKLMEVNAFNQPNVELYKKKTKAVLGL